MLNEAKFGNGNGKRKREFMITQAALVSHWIYRILCPVILEEIS